LGEAAQGARRDVSTSVKLVSGHMTFPQNRDYRNAVETFEQAEKMREVALRMDDQARGAIIDARRMRTALDLQLEMLSGHNGHPIKLILGDGNGLSPMRGDKRARLVEILDWAIATTHADMGNIQLFDSAVGALRIKVQRGFDGRFLDFFDNVHTGEAACGTALQTGEQVVVEDVTESPIFLGTDSLEVMLNARARAVQSTPLISNGNLIGMLSTHYHRPLRPSGRDLCLLELLARRAGRFIGATRPFASS